MRLRPLLLARYYVATTAALGAGLYDHLRHGTPAVLGRGRRARGELPRASASLDVVVAALGLVLAGARVLARRGRC